MKGIIVIIILAAAGYFTYDHFFAARMSSAYKAYEVFAEYMDKDNFRSAKAMGSSGSGIESAAAYRWDWKNENRGQKGILYIKESFRKIDYSDIGDGYASFTIIQKSFTEPPTTGPTDHDYLITQEIEMETDADDEWFITSFSEMIEPMQ